MISDAVSISNISKIIGYKITKGNFSNTTSNLPHRIAILGEANTENQATLDLDPFEFTSAQQVGARYGYGSPLYHIARILRPLTGGGVGSIPTIIYPQATESGDAKILELVATGTANKGGTHTVLVSGREGIDGVYYDINIASGDTPSIIHGKIADAINNVLGSPCTADDYDPTKVECTTKWEGKTAEDFNIIVDTGDDDLGITYTVTQTQAATGTPSIQAALDLFLNDWNTIVINSYGAVSSVMTTLESFNGKPDPTNPSGRYTGIVMKPFIALTGSLLADPSSITDARLDDVTIAICPAPQSTGFQFEAAANMCVLFAPQAQNNPHLDVAGMNYPDMPTPDAIGTMIDYTSRDLIVKKGCSTVDLIADKYQVQDLVTTYHPVGETPPQFRYCRNLNIDWNVRYGYYLLELIHVLNHAIGGNDDIVTAIKVVKPKMWKQVLDKYADDLELRALITDSGFMQDSIDIDISTTNPDRFETFFRYKRTGFVRIASTTAEAGFNFGS
jgi:phage tail sheath gpL-like